MITEPSFVLGYTGTTYLQLLSDWKTFLFVFIRVKIREQSLFVYVNKSHFHEVIRNEYFYIFYHNYSQSYKKFFNDVFR